LLPSPAAAMAASDRRPGCGLAAALAAASPGQAAPGPGRRRSWPRPRLARPGSALRERERESVCVDQRGERILGGFVSQPTKEEEEVGFGNS